MVDISTLNKKEKDNLLIALLDNLELRTMAPKVMSAVNRKFVLTPIETVIFREHQNEIQVLLVRRDKNDPDWPELWHSPGTVLRVSDEARGIVPREMYHDPIRRLVEMEIGAEIKSMKFAFPLFHNQARGKSNAMVFVCTIDESNDHNGTWYPVDNLPENTIKSHRIIIDLAQKSI